MLKKILSMIALSVVVFAGVEQPFVQFTQTDYCNPHVTKPGQWTGAGNPVDTFSPQMITLDVKADTDVWLSNYVRSWYEPIADLHGNVYNMSAGSYGYIFSSDLDGLTDTNYADAIHWANGATTDITYVYDPNPAITNTATGYFLDHFDTDAEIYIVMTTLAEDGGETVDSYQYVQDADHETTLYSRQHNTYDLAGNVRINFGIDTGVYGDGQGTAREFVAVYNHPTGIDGGHQTGGPLPGLPFAAVLSFGTIAALKRKKH